MRTPIKLVLCLVLLATVTVRAQWDANPIPGAVVGTRPLLVDPVYGLLEYIDPSGVIHFSNMTLDGGTNITARQIAQANLVTNIAGVVLNQDATNLLARTIVAPSFNRASAIGTVPYFGFNSWLANGNTFTELQLLQTMTNFIVSGVRDTMKNYGVVPVLVLDDGWAAQTNITGTGLLTNDAVKFPDGIPYLSSLLESNGFHLGLWICPAYFLQMGFAGGNNNSANTSTNQAIVIANANQLVSWGIHFLKYDGAFAGQINGERPWDDQYVYLIQQAYQQAGCPLYLQGGNLKSYDARYAETYSLMRAPDDATSWAQFCKNIEFWATNQTVWNFTMPGLTRGIDSTLDGGTPGQQRSSFAYSALLPAPIESANAAAWNTVGYLKQAMYLYTNLDILSAVEDIDVSPGRRIASWGEPNYTNLCEAWARNLADGTELIGLLNHSVYASSNITINLKWAGLAPAAYTLKNLFSGQFEGYATNNTISRTVPAADVCLLKVYTGALNPFVPGTNFLKTYDFNQLTYSNNINGVNANNAVEQWPLWDCLYPGASYIPTLGGVAQTNCLTLMMNGGCDFYLGGNCTSLGFTANIDDLTATRNVSATNAVTVWGDGVLLWSNQLTAAAGSILSNTVKTNLSMAGVNNVHIQVVNKSAANADYGSTWVDFGGIYVIR